MEQGYLHPNKRHVIKIVHAEQLTVRNKQLHTFIVCFKAMIELYKCVKKKKMLLLWTILSQIEYLFQNVVVLWYDLPFSCTRQMSIEITFVHTVAASYMKQHIKNKDSMLIFTFFKNIPFPQLCFFSKPLFYSTSNWQITEEPLEQTNYADRNCMCTTL